MTDPAIGVAPSSLRPGPELAERPLSILEFPLGLPDRLNGAKFKDLRPDDHVIFNPKSVFYWRRNLGFRAQVSLKIGEPRVNHGWHMKLLRLYHRRFFRILTRDRQLLRSIPNGIFLAYAFSFLTNPKTVDTAKSRTCSLIASARRNLEGHQLRHRIVELARAEGLDVDVMGRGYAPFDAKEDGLAPYRYSVIIENTREPAYFSEKLIDAALCRTVPIYWGAPDIADWFDVTGMILCEDENAIMNVLRALPETPYEDFATALDVNRERALAHMNGNLHAAELLAGEIGLR